MKILIFLIVVGLVFYAVYRKNQKSQAEVDLARRKRIERRKEREKETLTSHNVVDWQAIGPAASLARAEADPEPAEADPEALAGELSMASIDYVPTERP